MRLLPFAVLFASLPAVAPAESVHAVEVLNGMRSGVASFAVAPAGSGRWVTLDMRRDPPEYGVAFTIEITAMKAGPAGSDCLHDFRTVLMDGRVVVVRDFDVCSRHQYRLGVGYRL
ncbi:hypothetical protein [Dyella subtropica]|uniref:hypothetical protein n=1 Tax=Dyella subtropica TaxID=2992127 RepID=UPI0022522E2C|nr:hypothetical protein [Dyella subtropica]